MRNVLRISTIKTLLVFGLIADISYTNFSRGSFFIFLFIISCMLMAIAVSIDIRKNVKRYGCAFVPVNCNRQVIANVLRYLAVLLAIVIIFTTYSSSHKAERVDNVLSNKYVQEIGIPFKKIVYYVPDVSLDALELGIVALETSEDLQREVKSIQDTVSPGSEDYYNEVNRLVLVYTEKLTNIETKMNTIKVSHVILAIRILTVELMFFVSCAMYRGYILKPKKVGV